MANNPKHEDNLKPFKKGQSGNPKGRPRKYVSLLVDQGYKKVEINDAIQAMLSMTLDELEDVFKNKQATILERTVAKAMKKSLDKGSLYSLETLITRVHGQPKQEIEQTIATNIKLMNIDPLADTEE